MTIYNMTKDNSISDEEFNTKIECLRKVKVTIMKKSNIIKKIGTLVLAATLAVTSFSPVTAEAATKAKTKKEIQIVETRDCLDAKLEGNTLTLSRSFAFQDLTATVVEKGTNKRVKANVTCSYDFDEGIDVRKVTDINGNVHFIVLGENYGTAKITFKAGKLKKTIKVKSLGKRQVGYFTDVIRMNGYDDYAIFTADNPYCSVIKDQYWQEETMELIDRFEITTVYGPWMICTYRVNKGNTDHSDFRYRNDDGKVGGCKVYWQEGSEESEWK